jgi:hypothetical protein
MDLFGLRQDPAAPSFGERLYLLAAKRLLAFEEELWFMILIMLLVS